MDYQSYEDYMRSVLGYQNGNIYANTYGPKNDYYYDMPQMPMNYSNGFDSESLNQYYPETYKMLYPMVCKVCNQNMQKEITKELIDRMTDEVYYNFEAEDRQMRS